MEVSDSSNIHKANVSNVVTHYSLNVVVVGELIELWVRSEKG